MYEGTGRAAWEDLVGEVEPHTHAKKLFKELPLMLKENFD